MATPIPANLCAFTADEIADATAARPPREAARLRLHSVSIDTRTIAPGALFVALRGVRDGHVFLQAATARGAAAALVERGRGSVLPCFEVDDSLAALGALARHHLRRIRATRTLPIIAIGGAAGKTTTKELTAAVVHALFGEILATPGNLNNLIGVPMTALMLTSDHRAAVLECGTNQRGEIPRLAEIVRPDVALVLNVDIEHTEGLGSLEGVADEEASLFSTARAVVTSAAELLAMATAVASVKPVEGRLRTSKAGGIVIIDDTYNANPRSVRAALAAARETADALEARLLVALGDMLELGGLSTAMHAEIVRDLVDARPAAFIAVGAEMAAALDARAGAGGSSDPMTVVARNSGAAAALVRDLVRPGDVLLVKGSRGLAMERIIDALSTDQ